MLVEGLVSTRSTQQTRHGFLPLCIAASSLFKLLLKYRPEDKAAKKLRLLNKAKAEAEGKTVEEKRPFSVKHGLNHVTYLIEQVRVVVE